MLRLLFHVEKVALMLLYSKVVCWCFSLSCGVAALLVSLQQAYAESVYRIFLKQNTFFLKRTRRKNKGFKRSQCWHTKLYSVPKYVLRSLFRWLAKESMQMRRDARFCFMHTPISQVLLLCVV